MAIGNQGDLMLLVTQYTILMFWLELEQNKIRSPTDGMILTKFEVIYYLWSFICIACCLMISLAFWQISLFTEFPQIDRDQKGYQKTLQNTDVSHPLFFRDSGQAECEYHLHPGAHQTLWCDTGTTPQLKASDRFPRFSFHLRHLTLIPVLLGQSVPRKFCSNQWFLSALLTFVHFVWPAEPSDLGLSLASVWPHQGHVGGERLRTTGPPLTCWRHHKMLETLEDGAMLRRCY